MWGWKDFWSLVKTLTSSSIYFAICITEDGPSPFRKFAAARRASENPFSYQMLTVLFKKESDAGTKIRRTSSPHDAETWWRDSLAREILGCELTWKGKTCMTWTMNDKRIKIYIKTSLTEQVKASGEEDSAGAEWTLPSTSHTVKFPGGGKEGNFSKEIILFTGGFR